MGLPSIKQVQDFNKYVDKVRPDLERDDFTTYEKLKKTFTTLAKKGLISGAQKAAQAGVTAFAAPASGLAVGGGVVLFTVGMALAPWFAVTTIAFKADGINSLIDLRDGCLFGGKRTYACSCGTCKDTLKYIIDKKETKIAVIAVAVFTAGVGGLAWGGYNAGKKLTKGPRPMELNCRQLHKSARSGCDCAVAAVMKMSGNWPKHGPASLDTMTEAASIILAKEGWQRLKKYV